MQMRSAEEAQTSAMDHEPPTDPVFGETPRSSDGNPSAEGAAPDVRLDHSVAEQDTTIISAPDDPFAGTDASVQPRPGQALRVQRPAAQVGYAPPQVRAPRGVDSTNGTTMAFTPNTAAGASYLFLWISGVLVYFNERRNTYVRFHALQSILFGAVATVVGVVGIVLAVLLMDLGTAWHASILNGLGLICALLIPFSIMVVWWSVMVAAWTGHEFALPILGRYAKHYSAPEGQPLPTSRP